MLSAQTCYDTTVLYENTTVETSQSQHICLNDRTGIFLVQLCFVYYLTQISGYSNRNAVTKLSATATGFS